MKNYDATVTVLGAGYVGLTTAAILSNNNFKVFVVEPNRERLDVIKQGRSFFFEEGLDPLVAKGIADGNLVPTDSYEHSVPESDFIFSCVGTPDNPDGSSNLTYVFSAAELAISLAKPGAIYIQKSTVPVGTGERIEELIAPLQKNLSYVSNPEFLREGTALADSLYFDRVVAGGRDKEAVKKVIVLYKEVEKHRDAIAKLAGVKAKEGSNLYIETGLNSAELIKVTSNAFLALKISFANSIAKLADQAGADINEVMDAVGADQRIKRAFFNTGRGYGGGCFPKDVSGLISSAAEHGVDLPIMVAAAEVNESMPGYIANKAQETIGGGLEGKKTAVLGLAFKAGTSDSRRSPGVKLANSLSAAGAVVTTYDPEANGEAKADLRKGVEVCSSLEVAVKDADAVFIATEWPQFLQYDLSALAKQMSGTLFVDCVNAFDISRVEDAGFNYIGVGRG